MSDASSDTRGDAASPDNRTGQTGQSGQTGQTGRCLCGAVRYSFDGAPSGVDYCHCDSCRRNCSAPVTVFVEVPRTAFRFTGQAPKVYESSPGTRRLFCGTCGSPMAYDADWDTTDIHLYLATLDDPLAYQPTYHVFTAERLAWFDVKDDLPRHAGSSLESEQATAGKTGDQK